MSSYSLKEMTVGRRIIHCGLDDQYKDALEAKDIDKLVDVLLQVEVTEKEAKVLAKCALDDHKNRKETVWDVCFFVSCLISGFCIFIGSILGLFLGKDVNSNKYQIFTKPLAIIFFVAFTYSFVYMVQKETSKTLRYFFIYPSMLFFVLVLAYALLAI